MTVKDQSATASEAAASPQPDAANRPNLLRRLLRALAKPFKSKLSDEAKEHLRTW